MADEPISGLPAAVTLTGTELIPVVQGGVTSKSTINDIQAFVLSGADLVSVLANTASGAIAVTPTNSAGFSIYIPIDNADVTTHTINFGIQGTTETYNFISLVATGAGEGAIVQPSINIMETINFITGVDGNSVNFAFGDSTLSSVFYDLFGTYGVGFYAENNPGQGGLFFAAGMNGDNPGLSFVGLNGSTTPTQGGINFTGAKSDGAGAVNPFANNELLASFVNNFGGATVLSIYGNGDLGTLGMIETTGSTAAAATTLTMPRVIRINISAGTGTINNISNTGYEDFDEVEILFTGNVTVTSSAGGSGQIRLAGNLTQNFQKYDVLALRYYAADDIFVQTYLSVNN